jgi:hypothetical protein
MELKSLFEANNYKSIKYLDESKKPIEEFTMNIRDNNLQYSNMLNDIYLHTTNNEMFIILDCVSKNTFELKNVCDEWENYVLNFINLDKNFEKNIDFLKYNITLIILCKDNKVNMSDDNFRYSMEKSLRICRKLFLLCDENNEIIKNELRYLPFNNADYELPSSSQITSLEQEIHSYLPEENSEIFNICINNEKVDDNIDLIIRWLNDDDNK